MANEKQARSKPREITFGRSWDGPKGTIFYFNIQFEDGIAGEFSTTKREQTKFVIGTEVLYSYEDTSNARGPFVKIDLVKETYTGGGGGKKSPEVQRSILANVCLDCAINAIYNLDLADKAKPDLKNVFDVADKFYNYIKTKSNNDTQANISLQARLKDVTMILVKFKSLGINSSDKVLEYVDKEYEYVFEKMKG